MNKLFNGVVLILAWVVTGAVQAQESSMNPAAVERTAPAQDREAAPRTAPAPLDTDDLGDWLDGYMGATLEAAQVAGAVVSVVKDGRLLLSRGYGYADVEAEKPMNPARSLVRVGSTSKLFTWTAVMQLVEQGRLELDRDVNDYLDFRIPPRGGDPVTMSDLMTHRGGFEEGVKDLLITDPARLISTETFLKEHVRPRIFDAGTVPAYSNYGTALAGYIVARISGQPFFDYVDEHLLAPLDMRHSSFRQPLPATLEADMARGYMSRETPPWPFEFVTTAPAGSLSATAEDMANFMLMHLQGGRFEGEQILSEATAKRMHRSAEPSRPGFAAMAHGFFSGTHNGHRVIGHGGDTVVFHTDMNLLPDEGVGFFVSFNSRGRDDAVYGLRQRLFEQFMDRYFPAPAGPAAPPALDDAGAHARAVAGYYQSSRRIQTAFLKLVYVLQQVEVAANDDGTLNLSTEPDKRYREVVPGEWREVGGDQRLYIAPVDGRMTIVDSDNPASVLQAVPAAQSAGLNTVVLVASAAVLLLVLLGWPVGWCYRRHYGQQWPRAGRQRLAYRLARFSALATLAYLLAWYFAFQPLLQNQLDAYGPGLDGLLRTLQVAAVIPLAAAAIGVWNVRLSIREGRWTGILVSLLLAASLLGVVWIAWVGRLIGFNLEY